MISGQARLTCFSYVRYQRADFPLVYACRASMLIAALPLTSCIVIRPEPPGAFPLSKRIELFAHRLAHQPQGCRCCIEFSRFVSPGAGTSPMCLIATLHMGMVLYFSLCVYK